MLIPDIICFFTVLTFALMVQSTGGWKCWSLLPWTKDMAPNHTSIIHHHKLLENMLDSLKVDLGEIVKFMNWVHVFLTFCVRKWQVCLGHFCYILYTVAVSRKSTSAIELRVEVIFFHGNHFYLQKWVIDKLWSFTVGYLADIFLKMNTVSMSL